MSNLLEVPLKDVKDFNVVHEEGEVSNKEFNEAIKMQGIWGFVDDEGCIHYWLRDKTVPIEEVIAFIAHETGHMNGRNYKDQKKEEEKAHLTELIAVYAYKEAMKLQRKSLPK